jgi:leucine dehydrogenase
MINFTDYMEKNGHEFLAVFVDKESGLKAVLAVHDSSLGPGLGPPCMKIFESEQEAIEHALVFSHGQTYKYAVAGIPFGGGRMVVMEVPEDTQREAVVRALGRCVESLGGRYVITGGGIGFSDADTRLLKEETQYIIGLPTEMGGSGEPAVMAGYGIYWGMKACTQEVFKTDALNGKVVALQGFGKVGSALAEKLKEENVDLIVADIRPQAAELARRKFGAQIVSPDSIYDVACDIFSPCAWGQVLNDETISRLRCKIVAGSANKQLVEPQRHSQALAERGIQQTLEDVFTFARDKQIMPAEAAEVFARQRLQSGFHD